MVKQSWGTDLRKRLFKLPFPEIPGPFPVNVNVCYFRKKRRGK
jgi:hypothetical protein